MAIYRVEQTYTFVRYLEADSAHDAQRALELLKIHEGTERAWHHREWRPLVTLHALVDADHIDRVYTRREDVLCAQTIIATYGEERDIDS